MYILYYDETNFAKKSGDFFVYGGVVIDPAHAADLSKEIERIRKELGVPRDYVLKFNPGPKKFTHDQFIELKQSVIQAACAANCKLLVNLLLHDIATSSEEARRFGINTLSFHFDCYLNPSHYTHLTPPRTAVHSGRLLQRRRSPGDPARWFWRLARRRAGGRGNHRAGQPGAARCSGVAPFSGRASC